MSTTSTRALRPCTCVSPSHEHPRCENGQILATRSSIYAGLYDSRSGSPAVRRTSGAPTRKVRILNPDYAEDDAAGRRFAQLEID